ncbi:hypothetical protein SAMN05428976_11353 [Clostridium sp. USBA 49]|uniref:hypothetical protein n=1 Tax=Clostridium sp. USBA 49 TaxID=1881060 RepID=UPI00099ADA7D|nr:hypothetical protein [Clostridium sp. USBA 49]SKA89744.1 hypothetical protein SAMN05428976_11353 [Clostridium sp. USBA 49]
MIGYAFINKDTNILDYICSWGDNEMPADYPIEDNQYVVKLDENKYKEIEKLILERKKIKILDIENFEYEEIIEGIEKTKSEIDYLIDLDFRLSKIELNLY